METLEKIISYFKVSKIERPDIKCLRCGQLYQSELLNLKRKEFKCPLCSSDEYGTASIESEFEVKERRFSTFLSTLFCSFFGVISIFLIILFFSQIIDFVMLIIGVLVGFFLLMTWDVVKKWIHKELNYGWSDPVRLSTIHHYVRDSLNTTKDALLKSPSLTNGNKLYLEGKKDTLEHLLSILTDI